MKQLLDLLPIVAFFGVYLVLDIYAATIALMAAAAAQVAFFKLKAWRVSGQMWMVFWCALGFGAMTLLFRDPLFIQWKPSIVYWALGLGLAGARFVGRGDHLQRALGKALVLPDRAWRALSWSWAAAMGLAGAANLAVAYNFSEQAWVAYKFASAFAVPLLLVLASFGYLGATEQLPTAPGERRLEGSGGASAG